MKTTRQAVMKVNRELLEQLLPDWQTRARSRYGDMVDGRAAPDVEAIAGPYHAALKLPSNCRITGISTDLLFSYDEIAFRIESPDFVETHRGEQLPEVQAVYEHFLHCIYKKFEYKETKREGYFLRWEGPAVAVRRTYGPNGREAVGGYLMPCPDKLPAEDWENDLTQLFENTKREQTLRGFREIAERNGRALRELEPRIVPSGEKLAEAGCFLFPPGTEEFRKTLEVGYLPTAAPNPPLGDNDLHPCWRCHNPTTRRLPDGTAECQECASKSLL